MKLIFAPDSFKGSLSARQIAQMLDEAAARHFPAAERICVPLADGGEGTLDTMRIALGGRLVRVTVSDPLDRPVEAEYLISGDTAVVEMAKAAGYALLKPEERDPAAASTYGVGQLVKHAIASGAKKILLGLGGSITNDGGMGFLIALGARFYGADGRELRGCGASLEKTAACGLSAALDAVKGVSITAIADVTNPLTGTEGATYVYGPQKGVTETMMPVLDAGMKNYADVLEKALGRPVDGIPGAGAAGGLGAAAAGVLGAKILRGIDAVFEATDFDEKLAGASLVITGEGRLDGQSILYGKAPVGVYRKARAAGVPVVLLTGGVGPGGMALDAEDGIAVFPVVNAPMPVTEAIGRAEELMRSACERLMLILKFGFLMERNNDTGGKL